MKFVGSAFAGSVVLPADKRDKNEVRLSEKAKTCHRSYQTTRLKSCACIFSSHFSFSCFRRELPALIIDKNLFLHTDHTDNGRNERIFPAFPGFRCLHNSIRFDRPTCDRNCSTQQVPLPTCIRQGKVIRELTTVMYLWSR